MANRMISFGYGIDGNKICVIDREAVVVSEIFEKYAAGKLLQEIADELTARNVDFVQGNCNWNKNRVEELYGNKTRKEAVQSRLQDVYAIMDGLKNHQIVYNDELIRQIIEVVIVESKEKIKIIFKGGLTVEENL